MGAGLLMYKNKATVSVEQPLLLGQHLMQISCVIRMYSFDANQYRKIDPFTSEQHECVWLPPVAQQSIKKYKPDQVT